MKTWIVPCKVSVFLIEKTLAANEGFVDWRQSNDFSIGDVVFIYKTRPESCIRHKLEVEAVNMNFEDATDKEIFWKDKTAFFDGYGTFHYVRFRLVTEYPKGMFTLNALHEHGLRGNIQSVMLCKNEQLLAFLNGEAAVDEGLGHVSGETQVGEDGAFTEGAVHEVVMDIYERSAKARAACLAAKGYQCAVCGMDFEATYGEIGEGFIHVHHIVPISSIGEEYVVDGVRDLVPVCPNCHNMLHRRTPPYSIEELKQKVRVERDKSK